MLDSILQAAPGGLTVTVLTLIRLAASLGLGVMIAKEKDLRKPASPCVVEISGIEPLTS